MPILSILSAAAVEYMNGCGLYGTVESTSFCEPHGLIQPCPSTLPIEILAMASFVDNDLVLFLDNVDEDTVRAPVILSVRLTVPRLVIPIHGRPELRSSDTLKLLLNLGNGLAVQRLEHRLESASEGNVVGHG